MTYIPSAGPGLGIGSGIGMQAMAGEIIEWPAVTVAGTVKKPAAISRSRRMPRTQLMQPLGACCSSCAGGNICKGFPSLGATVELVQTRPSSVSVVKPPPPPGAFVPPPPGGVSPIIKIGLLAGLAVGGVFLYRKFKSK